MDMGAAPRRVSDLYHEALQHPPANRAAFLADACGDDDALRRDVESLLEYDAAADAFLETPAFEAFRPALVPAASAPGPPARFGPYQLLDRIGAGGMGEVYRARDTKLGRDVAIKILPPHLMAQPERRARFAREARLLATLNHPRIGAIYGLEDADGVTALVLELVEGSTLSDRLERGPLPMPQAIAIARQIAEALDAAHAKGIVHRDLKPANVMVHEDAYDVAVKVLDFGVAKSLIAIPDDGFEAIAPADPQATAHGRILGTPGYMSPEQARGLPVDRRTDVWAFGCVLFEMLSGRPPFEADTTAETMALVLESEPRWTSLPPGLPDAVVKLLRRCLQKDPARRVRDIRDAILDMDEGLSDPPHVPARGAIASHWRTFVMTTGAIATIGAGAWLWGTSATPPLASRPPLRLTVDLGPDVELSSGVAPAIQITPGGDRLVFLANGHLQTRGTQDETITTLQGTDGAVDFFLSPDGKEVAFAADGKLKRMPLAGGVVATICDIPRSGLRGGAWGHDGTIIFGSAMGGLKRVPAAGGEVSAFTVTAPGEFTHRWPTLLPGGPSLLFTNHRYPSWFDRAGVDAVSLRDGSRKTVVTDASFGRFISADGRGYLTFSRGGSLFAVPFDVTRLVTTGTPFPFAEDVASNSTMGSAQVDFSPNGLFVYRKGVKTILTALEEPGAPAPLLSDQALYEDPALSADGTHVAFALAGDLWVYDLQRRVRTRITNGIAAAGPLWSPDGRFVLFSTFDNIAWVPADGGSKPRVLLPDKAAIVRYPTALRSVAGRPRLAFMEFVIGATQGWDLWTVPLQVEAGGLRAGTPEPFRVTPDDERQLQFSPDGRWAAYSSTESGGQQEIYVRAFPDDGRRWKLSDGGGSAPQWSGPHAAVFFQSPARQLIAASYRASGTAFVPSAARVWSTQRLIEHAGPSVFSISGDGTRLVALVPDPGAADQSRHVVSLWTDVAAMLNRAAFAQPH